MLGAVAQSSPVQSPSAKPAPARPETAKSADATSGAASTASAKPASAKAKTTKTASAKKSAPKPITATTLVDVSETVADLAGWVMASGDNRELPFAIIDKDGAQVLVFDAKGTLKGRAPVLIGSAIGDESAEGVGDRELTEIPMGERTTPAGRFVVGYGPAKGGQRVLWVDYATAISIHALPADSPKKEKRKERMASKTPNDNRITHGCINVSSTFYTKVVRATFKKDGVFYILPDEIPLQTAFPAFEPRDRIASSS